MKELINKIIQVSTPILITCIVVYGIVYAQQLCCNTIVNTCIPASNRISGGNTSGSSWTTSQSLHRNIQLQSNLCSKNILADFDHIPVLIFDEVDAGIGGKTAESVGKKLRALSSKHQVLCTTHLPQIASMGNVHLSIDKGQRNGRAYVEVKELSGQERMREIARMLSGKITESSMKHAKELLEFTV